MNKFNKITAAILIVLTCSAVILTVKMFKNKKSENVNTAIPLPQRAKGNPEAQIKIIEFIDFQCPACANGAKSIREYLKKYPEQFYVELRYFPLAMHKHGMTSARWGECAVRQKKFWPFFDELIDKQSEWSILIDPTASFQAIAQKAGLNQNQLDACLQDPTVEQVINTDIEEGRMRQVSSTPSYFINHEMVVGSKSMRQKIDALLGIQNPDPAAVSAGANPAPGVVNAEVRP